MRAQRKKSGFAEAGLLPLGAHPLVGRLHDAETRRDLGIPDAQGLDLHEEEGAVVIGVAVQPGDRLTMLVAGASDDPDHHTRVLARCVRDDFPEVIVIGGTELVLDDHVRAVLALHLREDVRRERADGALALHGNELEADGIAEASQVVGLGEPRGEVALLVP